MTGTMKGLAIVCFAAAMGTSNTASARPTTPCTAENERERVTDYNRNGGSTTSVCMDGSWQQYAICDRSGRCVLVI